MYALRLGDYSNKKLLFVKFLLDVDVACSYIHTDDTVFSSTAVGLDAYLAHASSQHLQLFCRGGC